MSATVTAAVTTTVDTVSLQPDCSVRGGLQNRNARFDSSVARPPVCRQNAANGGDPAASPATYARPTGANEGRSWRQFDHADCHTGTSGWCPACNQGRLYAHDRQRSCDRCLHVEAAS